MIICSFLGSWYPQGIAISEDLMLNFSAGIVMHFWGTKEKVTQVDERLDYREVESANPNFLTLHTFTEWRHLFETGQFSTVLSMN